MLISVAQVGSRMHYAVPRTFQVNNVLEFLYTDICATTGFGRVLSSLPFASRFNAIRRLAGRKPAGIPPKKIKTEDLIGLNKAYYYYNRFKFDDFEKINLKHISDWCRAVAIRDPGQSTHIYGFNSCSLEIFESPAWLKRIKVLEQTIAPLEIERELLRKAADLYDDYDWKTYSDNKSYQAACERQSREWALADQILCGSDFVRNGLISLGVPPSKCFVVPYGFGVCQDPGFLKVVSSHTVKLNVLFVGAVGLRKGAPILLEVAKQVADCANVIVAGQLDCSPEFEADLRRNCQVLGIVNRIEMAIRYKSADVLLLPSFCEGSATVTYEALNLGVPVICTENSGSTVVSGESGYIVPAFSVNEIVVHIRRLANDRNELIRLSQGALSTAKKNTEEAYGIRLMKSISNI